MHERSSSLQRSISKNKHRVQRSCDAYRAAQNFWWVFMIHFMAMSSLSQYETLRQTSHPLFRHIPASPPARRIEAKVPNINIMLLVLRLTLQDFGRPALPFLITHSSPSSPHPHHHSGVRGLHLFPHSSDRRTHTYPHFPLCRLYLYRQFHLSIYLHRHSRFGGSLHPPRSRL